MKRLLVLIAIAVEILGITVTANAYIITNIETSTCKFPGQGTQASGSDSVVVWRRLPPNILVTKFAKNLRTGIENADMISAVSGDTIEFRVVWSNDSEVTADTVVFKDYVPSGMIFSSLVAGDTIVNGVKISYTESSGLIEYVATGVAGPDGNGGFSFRCTVTGGSIIVNYCTSTYQVTGNPMQLSGWDTVTVSGDTIPNIVVTKYAKNIRTGIEDNNLVTGIFGDTIEFRITWQNEGGGADTITLTDYIPLGMIYVANSLTSSETNCISGSSSESSGKITYTGFGAAGINPGPYGFGEVKFRVVVNVAGDFNNWCTSTYQLTGQVAQSSGSDSAIAQILPAPTAVKFHRRVRDMVSFETKTIYVVPGDTLEYKIRLDNNSGSTMTYVIMADTCFYPTVGPNVSDSMVYVAGSETATSGGAYVLPDSIAYYVLGSWTSWQVYSSKNENVPSPTDISGIKWYYREIPAGKSSEVYVKTFIRDNTPWNSSTSLSNNFVQISYPYFDTSPSNIFTDTLTAICRSPNATCIVSQRRVRDMTNFDSMSTTIPVVQGDTIQYKMRIENYGLDTATDVIISDTPCDLWMYTPCMGPGETYSLTYIAKSETWASLVADYAPPDSISYYVMGLGWTNWQSYSPFPSTKGETVPWPNGPGSAGNISGFKWYYRIVPAGRWREVYFTAKVQSSTGDIENYSRVDYTNLAKVFHYCFVDTARVSVIQPMISTDKFQKRRRDMAFYTTNSLTVVSGDSVTYRLRIANAPNRDTAANITVTDTLTFRNAIALTDTLTFIYSVTPGETTAKAGDNFIPIEDNTNFGTVTFFQYLKAGTSVWIDTTPVTLAASPEANQIWGLRWGISKLPGASGATRTGEIYFTVKIPSATIAGMVGDSFTMGYSNLAGANYTETFSNSIWMEVVTGPLLAPTKYHRRNKDMPSYTTSLFTAVPNDTVSYRLTFSNAQYRDTAANITVTDTLTFVNAVQLGNSVTFLDSAGGSDPTTDSGAVMTNGLGIVTQFQYTTNLTTWIDTTVQGLKASVDNTNRRILGLRWTIDKMRGSDIGDVQDNLFFTIAIPSSITPGTVADMFSIGFYNIAGTNYTETFSNSIWMDIISSAVSETKSYILLNPTTVQADGSSTCTATVYIKDSIGNPLTGKVVTLQSSRGNSDTIRDSIGGTVNPQSTDINGICTFTIKSNYSGTTTITALCDSKIISCTPAGVLLTFTASKLKIVTPSRTFRAGAISDSIVMEALDGMNNKDNNFNNTITLSTSSNSGSFSISNTAWNPVVIITLSNGQGAFYYKDNITGSPVITVSRAGLISDTQIQSVIYGAIKLKIVTPMRTVQQGSTSDSICVQAQTNTGALDVSFYGTMTYSSSTTGRFSPDGTNWSAGNTFVAWAANGETRVYSRDTTVGTWVITVSASNLQSDTQFISITSASLFAPVITNTSVSPVVFSPNGDMNCDSITISYTFSDSDSAYCTTTIRVYNLSWSLVKTLLNSVPEDSGTHSVVWDGKSDTGINVGEDTYIFEIIIYDESGNDSVQGTVYADLTSPSGSVNINSGNNYTNDINVTLTLSATDTCSSVDKMVISNYSDFSIASTYTYATSISWILSAGDGAKIVYTKFIDSVGNISSAVSDTILLDITPPSGSILIDSGAISTSNTIVFLVLSVADTQTTVDTAVISNYSNFTPSNTYTYANTISWILISGSGMRTVYAKFIDSAGNVSQVYSDSIALLSNIISGKVTKPDSEPITGVIIDVLKDGNVIKSTTTLTDGTYQLSDLDSGTYILCASWTLNEITSSVSVTTTTGTTDNSFTLSVTCQLAQLGGQVANVKAKTTSFSFGHKVMTAESDGFVQLSQKGRILIKVPTDAGGNYSIPHLLPGKYTAKAFNGYIYSDPVEITLREGQFLTLNFTFQSLPENQVYTYPNPTRTGSLTFHLYCGYSVPEITIRIYNIAGEIVKEIPDSEIPRPGPIFEYIWDCKNTQSQNVASGVYIYQVIAKDKGTAEQKQVIKKLAIIR